MPEDFEPDCVYETGTDESGNPIWSSEGCTRISIDYVNSTVTCNCQKLARFTAGVGLVVADVTDPVSASGIADDDSDSDDTDFTRLPVMIYLTSFLWLMIIVTGVYDKILNTKR
jgi:hypothetical protein